MLCKLSLKNIRRSIRDYSVYFITLVLGIAIFYIFNAINTQASFLVVSTVTADILRLLSEVITGLSVFIAFVLGALIVYASRFLMKRRSREFALYMTLGMRKSSIAGILGMESLIIGLFSLAAGLVLGIILSQIMSTVVAQLFEANMTEFVFTFSREACLKTILYFAVIMAVVVLFDMILVGKSRLIRLMQTGSRAEKVRMKNPVVCVLVFVVGTAILVMAYRMVTQSLSSIFAAPQAILIPIVMGAVATFLIFWSLSGLLLGIISRFKNVYWRGLNSFTFRQLSGRVNTMVVSITVICLMLFLTISIMTAAFSMRDSMNKNIRELTPVDIQFDKTLATEETERLYLDDSMFVGPDGKEKDIPKEQLRKELHQDVLETFSDKELDLSSFLAEYVSVYIYQTDAFDLSTALGDVRQKLVTDHPSVQIYNNHDIMTVGDYNRIAELYGREPVTLGENEYLILCDYEPMIPFWKEVLERETVYQIFGHELQPAAQDPVYGFVRLSSIHENTGLVIVPDEVADPAYRAKNLLAANYAAQDDTARRETEEKIIELTRQVNADCLITTVIGYNTRIDIRDTSVSLGAVVTFLGLYLGFVFLISGAAILALKALSDSIDSKGRYHVLRQIGAEDKEIDRSLLRQQMVLFLMPLVLAGIHTIFGLRFSQLILEQMGTGIQTVSLLITILILLLIYGIYFFITYRSSRKIIKETV